MKQYYGIELLRFFSSVGIMVYHYSTSFFYLNLGNAYPFSSSLNLIYIYGDYAVSTFFVISGLVFSNIYLRQNNNESLKKFFIKRFARLYPLHILTLILILFLQLIFLRNNVRTFLFCWFPVLWFSRRLLKIAVRIILLLWLSGVGCHEHC